MDIATVVLGGIRIIFGFLLLMFIPGFLITLIYYPRLSDIPVIERLVYAAILSIGSAIVCVLVMDVLLGIDTLPANIVIVIIAFCVILALMWIIRRLFLTYHVTNKIIDSLKKLADYPVRVFQGCVNLSRDKINHFNNLMRKK